MSFNTFCRECSIHFADEFHKHKHVELYHYGVTPANPEISESVFYVICANVPAVRAKTCPVCFLYYEDVAECIVHVTFKHPSANLCSFFAPTKKTIISQWKRVVEAVFPGALSSNIVSAHNDPAAAAISDDDDESVVEERKSLSRNNETTQ